MTALLMINLLLGASFATTSGGLEHEVKVEFIERFVRFVEWPAGDITRSRLVIGVLGDSLVARHLERQLGGRPIRGAPPEIRRIEQIDELEGCDVLYIAGSEKARLEEILAHTRGRPILTVGDTQGYGDAGVVINLVREGEHLRFEINKRAADVSGLRLSSQLLQLAVIIDRG